MNSTTSSTSTTTSSRSSSSSYASQPIGPAAVAGVANASFESAWANPSAYFPHSSSPTSAISSSSSSLRPSSTVQQLQPSSPMGNNSPPNSNGMVSFVFRQGYDGNFYKISLKISAEELLVPKPFLDHYAEMLDTANVLKAGCNTSFRLTDNNPTLSASSTSTSSSSGTGAGSTASSGTSSSGSSSSQGANAPQFWLHDTNSNQYTSVNSEFKQLHDQIVKAGLDHLEQLAEQARAAQTAALHNSNANLNANPAQTLGDGTLSTVPSSQGPVATSSEAESSGDLASFIPQAACTPKERWGWFTDASPPPTDGTTRPNVTKKKYLDSNTPALGSAFEVVS